MNQQTENNKNPVLPCGHHPKKLNVIQSRAPIQDSRRGVVLAIQIVQCPRCGRIAAVNWVSEKLERKLIEVPR